jgi:hypothetical protein
MAGVTELYSMTNVTVSTAEVSVVSGTTTLQSVNNAGVYQIFFDWSNLAKGDEYVVRVKEKVVSTGAQKLIAQWTVSGAQNEVPPTPSFMLINGWDVTVQKVAGTDRAISASIRKAG